MRPPPPVSATRSLPYTEDDRPKVKAIHKAQSVYLETSQSLATRQPRPVGLHCNFSELSPRIKGTVTDSRQVAKSLDPIFYRALLFHILVSLDSRSRLLPSEVVIYN